MLVLIPAWTREPALQAVCLGISRSQPLSSGYSHSTCELKQTSILKSIHSIKNYGYLLQRDTYSHSSLPRLPVS